MSTSRPPRRCADGGADAAGDDGMIAFTRDQEDFRKSVARFVDAEVAPAAQALDERGEFPAALFRRIAELGWLALRYPEKYGGADADMTTYCLLAEELARGSLSVAAAAGMQSLMGTHFIFKYGGDELRERYLAPALRGELVATFAMTEPDAGSDVANLTTRAERRGDRWVLRGTKTWVTNAPVADVLTVAAKTSGERVAFGKPIGEHQAIGFKLADMLAGIHAAALLTYQAAGRLDAGRPVAREAAMTKLLASETAVKVTDEAARIFASYGLAMEYPVQRYFRDARFLLPGGGTSEILRLVIGRELDWDRGTAFC